MKSARYRWSLILTLTLLPALPGRAPAGSFPKPPDARTWIAIESSQCQDASGDACAAAAGALSGTYGSPPSISINASIDANSMRGTFSQSVSQGPFLYSSMVDTYTLHSSSLPAGTLVPITVSFHFVGTLQPLPWGCCGVFGGGPVQVKIGSTWDNSPSVNPESGRVSGFLGPDQQKSYNGVPPNSTAAPISIDLPASATINEAIGTPFDLAYQIQAEMFSASLDYSHTASIGFQLPSGVTITSTGGYGGATAVKGETWGRLKNRYR